MRRCEGIIGARAGARLWLLIGFWAGSLPVCWCAAADLEQQVARLLGEYRVDRSKLAVTVVDHRGKARVLLNADTALKPASNQKILTTAAGLSFLGKDHEYITRMTARTPLRGGVVAGDVVVEGTGDPNISGRFHDDEPLAVFKSWAARLKKVGLRRIDGDLVADDSFFDDERYLSGWSRKFVGRWFGAEVSPLSLNDNCVDIRVHPGRPGEKARVEVSPSSPFVSVHGAPDTVAGRKARVRIHRAPDSNRITVSGSIGSRVANWYDHVAVVDPSLFFAHTLKKTFEAEGVVVAGKARRISSEELAAKAAARVAPVVLLEHRSKLLLDLPVINKRSQNLHAEILLKSLGRTVVGQGSVVGGGKVIAKLLDRIRVSSTGLRVADGSGLSYENRVTARQLASTLHAMLSHDSASEFRSSLSVAGVDGTLRRRFKQLRHLVGRVRAKTGYVASVSALSGYVERDGFVWSFSILINAFTSQGLGGAKALQERIVDLVYQSMPGR